MKVIEEKNVQTKLKEKYLNIIKVNLNLGIVEQIVIYGGVELQNQID